MNSDYRYSVPGNFDASSRVWIYQADRQLLPNEVEQMSKEIADFVAQWLSHGEAVKGYGTVLFNQFIILMADEITTGVSGCSTDSSVRLVKEMETYIKVRMFDRQLLAFATGNEIKMIPLSQLDKAFLTNEIGMETLYFNNTIQTKQEWENNWIIPVNRSWISNKIKIQQTSL